MHVHTSAITNTQSLTRHPLFGHLSVIDLLLQSEVTDEAVNVAGLSLTVAIHPTHCLGVVTRVPRRVEHNDAVCSDQIYPQAARSVRNTAHESYSARQCVCESGRKNKELRQLPGGKQEDPRGVVLWVIKLIDKSFSF